MIKGSVLFFMIAIVSANLSSEIKIPSEPVEPKISSDIFIEDFPEGHRFNLILQISGKTDVVGTVNFETSNFYAFVENKGKRLIALKDLKAIIIRRWSATKKDERTFVYYPNQYELIFKDGSKLSISRNISLFNVIKVNVSEKRFVFYSYFYDYIKNGKWENRNKEENNIETNIPIEGCVTSLKLNE